MTEATGWLDAGDRWLFVSLNQGWLADIAAHDASSDPAAVWSAVRQHTARALHRSRQRDRLGSAMACRAMALTIANAGTLRAASAGPPAAHYLALADRVAAARGSAHEQANNHWCRARVARLHGQTAAARDWADQAATAFDRLDMAWHLAQVKPLLRVD